MYKRQIMDKMNLYKCAQALSVKWKSFFGLGTEYVGYFKWEMAWALMGYYLSLIHISHQWREFYPKNCHCKVVL